MKRENIKNIEQTQKKIYVWRIRISIAKEETDKIEYIDIKWWIRTWEGTNELISMSFGK